MKITLLTLRVLFSFLTLHIRRSCETIQMRKRDGKILIVFSFLISKKLDISIINYILFCLFKLNLSN